MSSVQTTLDGDVQHNTETLSLATMDDCTCTWPSGVRRRTAIAGITADGHKRTRTVEQCRDCDGRVN